jgi:hypothetical protein
MYYVYSYLREDCSPYYIGKGSGRRAYTKGPKEVKPPRDKSRVRIIKADLTEEEAFLLEKLYILMFGRVDLGTGILRNKSDGGDGSSGAVRSEETREKLRQANLGKKKPKEVGEKISKALTGRKLSEEMRAKLRAGHKGRKCTEEHKRKVSAAKASPHKITFVDGREIIVENIMDFCKQFSYKYSGIYNVKLGYRKFYRDIVEVQKII